MKNRILLAEQHLRRGVDANALIAAHLEGMGLETRLTMTGSQLYSHISRFEPHVIYSPWTTPALLQFLKKRAPEVPVVNAFQEQNTVLHQPSAPMVQWAGRADYLFAWGHAHAQRFRERFSRPTVRLTGNPRFDAYFDSEVAESFYPSREKLADRHRLPEEKDWVLFALDFPLLFQSKERIQELVERGDLSEKQIQITREIYQTVKGWMRKFSSDTLDSVVLIVRPHPGSNLKQIKRDFGGETNSVRFIRGGSLPPWILATDRYVSRASTSIMEAWLANIPAALIRTGVPIEAGLSRPHLSEAETSLSSYTDFQAFITGAQETSSRHQHRDFLSKYYRLDGNSSLRTAQYLRDIADQNKEKASYDNRGVKDLIEHVKFYVKKGIIEYGVNQYNPFDRPNEEFLSQSEAKRRISRLKKVI